MKGLLAAILKSNVNRWKTKKSLSEDNEEYIKNFLLDNNALDTDALANVNRSLFENREEFRNLTLALTGSGFNIAQNARFTVFTNLANRRELLENCIKLRQFMLEPNSGVESLPKETYITVLTQIEQNSNSHTSLLLNYVESIGIFPSSDHYKALNTYFIESINISSTNANTSTNTNTNGDTGHTNESTVANTNTNSLWNIIKNIFTSKSEPSKDINVETKTTTNNLSNYTNIFQNTFNKARHNESSQSPVEQNSGNTSESSQSPVDFTIEVQQSNPADMYDDID